MTIKLNFNWLISPPFIIHTKITQRNNKKARKEPKTLAGKNHEGL